MNIKFEPNLATHTYTYAYIYIYIWHFLICYLVQSAPFRHALRHGMLWPGQDCPGQGQHRLGLARPSGLARRGQALLEILSTKDRNRLNLTWQGAPRTFIASCVPVNPQDGAGRRSAFSRFSIETLL